MICRLNVARLANVPESVLDVASVKSKELEDEAGRKALHYLYVCSYTQLSSIVLTISDRDPSVSYWKTRTAISWIS